MINFDFNTLSINLYVTILVLIMVVLLPILDRFICKKLGLNILGGISANPDAPGLLWLRKLIIYAIFAVYLVGFLYVLFFSRSASEDYLIHIALFKDIQNAIQVDTGIFNPVIAFLTGDFSGVHIVDSGSLSEFYLNIMLFIPMGYLLPYLSKWFRAKVAYRPVLGCFLISLAVENIQLITRHGFYDLDDLVTNTIGGLIGELFFVAFAYVVTHPDWRGECRRYFRWRKLARKRTLYPFAGKISLPRTVLLATDESRIWDFYVSKLGFRVLKQVVPEDSAGTAFLLKLGNSHVEVRCSNTEEQLPKQYLTISAKKLDEVNERLFANGIEASPYRQDPFSGLRSLSFEGPDGVEITILEQ